MSFRQTRFIIACNNTLRSALLTAACMLPVQTTIAGADRPASPIVVRGDGWTISQDEIDLQGGETLYEISDALYQERLKSLRLQVTKRLLGLEAAKRNVSIPELVKLEVESKLPQVTEADIDHFYATNPIAEKLTTADRLRVKTLLVGQHRRDGLDRYVASLLTAHHVQVDLPRPPRPPFTRVDIDTPAQRTRGPADAPITIVEFSDFGCGYCRKASKTLDQLETEYAGQIRVVYKHFAVRDREGARAAECSAQQGAENFWAYHDALFESKERLYDDLIKMGNNIGLDIEQFKSCLNNPPDDVLAAEYEEAQALGVEATPYWFINGRKLRGALPIHRFRDVIDDELALIGKAKNDKTAQSKSDYQSTSSQKQ